MNQSALPSAKITPLFAVPFAQFSLPQPKRLCADLTTLILEKEAQGDRFRNATKRPTQGSEVFESQFDFFQWEDAPVSAVRDFCHRSLVSLLSHLGQVTPDSTVQLDYHAWFHVTRNGGFQGLHNHQNASWSGIFCVDPGDLDPAQPRSGVVRFHDPKLGSNMYVDPANRTLPMPFNNGVYEVQHRAGTLSLFPSYLTHEIFPYRGQRERIVIAFNCWARDE
ncbi:MAG: putative 2OG-Fe(II) oxygenase [Gammaproteobacteria bacterium]